VPRRLTRRVARIHWNPAAAGERLASLRENGFDARALSPQGVPGLRPVRDDPPDLFIVDSTAGPLTDVRRAHHYDG
jgi:hypothetical protein